MVIRTHLLYFADFLWLPDNTATDVDLYGADQKELNDSLKERTTEGPDPDACGLPVDPIAGPRERQTITSRRQGVMKSRRGLRVPSGHNLNQRE